MSPWPRLSLLRPLEPGKKVGVGICHLNPGLYGEMVQLHAETLICGYTYLEDVLSVVKTQCVDSSVFPRARPIFFWEGTLTVRKISGIHGAG